METTAITHRLTYPEYEALEAQSDIRHEFEDGQVLAMAGGTLNHNRLIRRVANSLEGQASLKRCWVLTENVRVEVSKGSSYRYPDVVLACHPFDLRGNNQLIRQPRLIVEVLSTSTERADRGLKWQQYRKIPSLIYYLLIDQYKVTVDLFSRVEDTDAWVNTFYDTLDDVIVLPRLNAELTLNAIYEDIELVAEEAE